MIFSEFPENLRLEAPTLGEHNEEILTDWLGYTEAEVGELGRRKILRSGPV